MGEAPIVVLSRRRRIYVGFRCQPPHRSGVTEVPAGVRGEGDREVGEVDAGAVVAIGVDSRNESRIGAADLGRIAADAAGGVGTKVELVDAPEMVRIRDGAVAD